MKRTFFIITLLSLILVSCEKTHEYNVNVYLYNELDENITLEVFKNEVKTNFELTSNDSVYFGSFSYIMNPNYRYFIFPGYSAYEIFLSDIDSVNVLYNSKKYTYQNDSIFGLFYPDSYWTIIFDEHKKQEFGWE